MTREEAVKLARQRASLRGRGRPGIVRDLARAVLELDAEVGRLRLAERVADVALRWSSDRRCEPGLEATLDEYRKVKEGKSG